MSGLQVENLSAALGGRPVLKGVSLDAYTPRFQELGLDDTLYLVQLAQGKNDGEAEEFDFLINERVGMKERHYNKLREALLSHRLAAAVDG